MTTQTAVPAARPATRGTTTRSLAGLAAAAPLWAGVSLAQAATREGFDLTRHPLSQLATGSLGWLQVANFVAAGALMAFGAVGLRAAVGSRWTARLVLVAGLGFVAAGLLPMDPGNGFPVGAGAPTAMSWHSVGHMAAGSVSFLALAAACLVLARHFRRGGDQRRAVACAVAGIALAAGDLWAMSGGAAGSATLAIGAVWAMGQLSWVAARA
ncbi:DUF998 domain-containing protein [Actinokineospora pegani]|uniref:DUF998 domain-containing protein n=1 Tax=Actinokineospora pegani TaxID=2654637 RepID=UPI0012E9FD5D|nr:DUF998 domain-containing protein [Actinokineospora pegani]